MKKLGLILGSLFLCSCSSVPLVDFCHDLERTADMTYDCAGMAEHLGPQLVELRKRIDSMEQGDVSGMQAQLNTLGICMSAVLKVQNGVCRTDEGVISALKSMDNETK